MTDAEFYGELAKRIGERDALTLGYVGANKISIKAGSLEFKNEDGHGWTGEVFLDGRQVCNCTKLVIIADGGRPGVFVAMEIDPRVKAF